MLPGLRTSNTSNTHIIYFNLIVIKVYAQVIRTFNCYKGIRISNGQGTMSVYKQEEWDTQEVEDRFTGRATVLQSRHSDSSFSDSNFELNLISEANRIKVWVRVRGLDGKCLGFCFVSLSEGIN